MRSLLAIWLLAPSLRALPQLELPAVLSDGMVLQRELPVPIWGWDAPGTEVRVTFDGQVHRTRADEEGAWRVRLDPLEAGGPWRMHVVGSLEVVIEDVLVGEVWLGSGQSNMAMQMSACDSFEEERARGERPLLRLFDERSGPASEAQRIGAGRWVTCTPESLGAFPGTLYHLGSALHDELDVPVGMLHAAMSGTWIEAWIHPDAQRAVPELAQSVAMQARTDERAERAARNHARDLETWRKRVRRGSADPEDRPERPAILDELRLRQGGMGGLYLGKVAPLVPYRLRGIAWYQGEANAYRPELYLVQLPTLVEDWRARWGDPELPFVWVQLPCYGVAGQPTGSRWPILRESQRRALGRVPGAGMVVALDVGEPEDLHPPDKRSVGERLARWSLARLHGRDGPWTGPLFAGVERRGTELLARFEHVDGGLRVCGPQLAGFEIASEGGPWHAAQASIEGEVVVLRAEAVAEPRAVRYGWANSPVATLCDGSGLPAAPFTSGPLDGSAP